MYYRISYKKPNSQIIDLMIINHFIIYFVIGYVVPHNYTLCLILSILWELFEIAITYFDYSYNLLVKYWPVPEYYWNEKYPHKIIDIIINFCGYSIGSYITTTKIKLLH